jgi:hypothetical protein
LNAADAPLAVAGSLLGVRLSVKRVSSKIAGPFAVACFTSSSVSSRLFPIPCSQTEMQPHKCQNI